MNRRLSILNYWLHGKKREVGFMKLVRFLLKPSSAAIAGKFIQQIRETGDYLEVKFTEIIDMLYWPRQQPLSDLHQVVAETFDAHDWHYYLYEKTPVLAGDTVVDAGCAEGLFALSVARRCRRLFLIEPNPVFIKSLKLTFSDFPPGTVEILPLALGKGAHQARLSNQSIGSRIDENGDRIVEVQSLDNLLTDCQVVSFIKIDVEGSEQQVLEGACRTIQRHKPRMAIACYHQGNDYQEMIRLVRSLDLSYQFHVKGLTQYTGRPVMIHFWVP
jgi:FkbM family methyltransferase